MRINFNNNFCDSGFVTYLLGLLLVHTFNREQLWGLIMDDLEDFAYGSFSDLGFEIIITGTFILYLLGLITFIIC